LHSARYDGKKPGKRSTGSCSAVVVAAVISAMREARGEGGGAGMRRGTNDNEASKQEAGIGLD